MNCPDEPTLLLFAEQLDDSCRDHVASCDGCRATVSELERTIGELRAALPAATNHAVERLLRPRPSKTPRRLFFVAAAVILAVTGAALARLSVGTRPKDVPPPPPVAPARVLVKDAGSEMLGEALAWLARNQQPGGSMGNVGLTGLALLAWFGAGHGETSTDFGPAIRSALATLMVNQNEKGQFVVGNDPKLLYQNSMAAWALCEAVAGKHSADPRVRLAAEKAMTWLIAAQNPGKGWRYSPRCRDNDTSVTFWATAALAAARRAGFAVPESVFDGARAWVREATDGTTLAVGYNAARTGKVYVPGMNEAYDHHQAMSAAAMALRLLAGDVRDASMAVAVGFLATDPPSAVKVEQTDYYYWHLGTVGLYLHEGAESQTWKDWQSKLIDALRATQDEGGSWKPTDRWAKDESAGRAYATAMNALTLTTANRFVRK